MYIKGDWNEVCLTLCSLLKLCTPSPFPQVISELEGKDINEVISEGMSKLASMPAGALDVHVLLFTFIVLECTRHNPLCLMPDCPIVPKHRGRPERFIMSVIGMLYRQRRGVQ